MKQVLVLLFFLQLAGFLFSQYSKSTLVGAGSSFAFPLYKNWAYGYKFTTESIINIEYSGVGSGTGKSMIISKSVDFAGSDSVLSTSEQEKTNNTLQMFPVVAGAVVLVYNIDLPSSISSTTLTLSREAVTGIFNGTILHWNDPLLLQLNPSLAPYLTNATISVVYRKGSSGTTEIFTGALSSFSPTYKAKYGVTSRFNVDAITSNSRGVGINTNLEAAYALTFVKNSIGYIALAEAQDIALPRASIINRNGKVTKPNTASVQAAMESAVLDPTNLTGSLVDIPVDGAYPIIGYTYGIVYKQSSTNCSTMGNILDFFLWAMGESIATDKAIELGYCPLPKSVVKKVTDALYSVKCGGKYVLTERIEGVELAMIILNCIMAVVLFIVAIFFLATRKHKVVRRSQLSMMLVMLLGALLSYVSSILLALPATTPTCNLIIPFIGIGSMLLYGSLIFKTMRIYQIFRHPFKVKMVPIWRSYVLLGGFLAFEVIIIVLWLSINTFQVQNQRCTSDNYALWISLFSIDKLVLFFIGLFVVLGTQRVSKFFNESQWIAFIMYNLVLIVCIFLPTNIAQAGQLEKKYVIQTIILKPSIGVFVLTTIVVAAMVIPKVVTMLVNDVEAKIREKETTEFDKFSLAMLQVLRFIFYIDEDESKWNKLEKMLAQHIGQTGSGATSGTITPAKESPRKKSAMQAVAPATPTSATPFSAAVAAENTTAEAVPTAVASVSTPTAQ